MKPCIYYRLKTSLIFISSWHNVNAIYVKVPNVLRPSVLFNNLWFIQFLQRQFFNQVLHKRLVQRLGILKNNISVTHLAPVQPSMCRVSCYPWGTTISVIKTWNITLYSRTRCFSTASSKDKPTHSASSAGISNCCLVTMHKTTNTLSTQIFST